MNLKVQLILHKVHLMLPKVYLTKLVRFKCPKLDCVAATQPDESLSGSMPLAPRAALVNQLAIQPTNEPLFGLALV